MSVRLKDKAAHVDGVVGNAVLLQLVGQVGAEVCLMLVAELCGEGENGLVDGLVVFIAQALKFFVLLLQGVFPRRVALCHVFENGYHLLPQAFGAQYGDLSPMP